MGGGAGRAASWTSSSVVYVPVIMQRQFPAILCPRFSSSTVAGYSFAETGTHSANCAAGRPVSSGAALGPVLDVPVIVQRGAQFACRGRRHLCRGADADPFGPCVQKIMEILQLQYIDRVIGLQCSVQSWRRQPSSHSCAVLHGHWRCTCPSLCNDSSLGSDCRKLRRSRSCSPLWSMSLLCRFILASSPGQGR